MKVTLRKRLKNNKISLYLDYYEKGVRKYEYLHLYLVPKPKNKLERDTNKKYLELADMIRAKRQIEVVEKKYGFESSSESSTTFIAYFESLARKRMSVKNNYGVWRSTLNMLKKYPKSHTLIQNIDKRWLYDLQEFMKGLKKDDNQPYAMDSLYTYYGKVRATINEALSDGILRHDPKKGVKGFAQPDSVREFLTLEELKKLVHVECELPVLKQAFLFSCLTGLRYGDVEKLKWNDIQYSENLGYFIRHKIGKSKTAQTVLLSKDTIDLLEHKEGEEDVFPGLYYSGVNNEKLRSWIAKAGINKHITFHCGRHTFATLQLSLDTDIYTVSKLLGHQTLKSTEIYAKIIDKKKKEAMNRIKL